MDDLIDFSDFDNIKSSKNQSLYSEEYDDITTEYYRVMRDRKMNVFMTDNGNIPCEKYFKFPYQWDPYTGERTGLDPYGALYFHPDDLTYHFYNNRLKGLWVDGTANFQGYYGDLVGKGDDMMIDGRGSYKELHVFRLPITDCYLPKNCDMSIITMGPILTFDELKEIDNITKKYHNGTYEKLYMNNGKTRPELREIRKYYDLAISKNPLKLGNNKNMSKEQFKMRNYKANISAIETLKNM